MYNGKDIIVSINGTAVAASKGCSLSVNQNFISACSPVNGRTKRKIPTDYSWSVSTDCLVADTAYADSIIDLLTQGTEVTLHWYDTQLNQRRKGQAVIASVKQEATLNNIATLGIEFEGSGALDKVSFTEITLNASSMTEMQHRYIYCTLAGIFIQGSNNESVMRKTIELTAPAIIKLKNTVADTCIVLLDTDSAGTATLINTMGNITSHSILHCHGIREGELKQTLLQPGTYTIIADKTDIQTTGALKAYLETVVN